MKGIDWKMGLGSSLINIVLRGLALVARFALALYIAKYLDLETVGEFGLIYGALAIAPAVLGLGINYTLNREIIHLPVVDAGRRIRDRLLVTLCMLTLTLLGVLAAMALGQMSRLSQPALVLPIALLEVVAFDVHMSLISLRKPVFANILLFMRTASWVYPYIGLGLIFPALRTFHFLLSFWLGGLITTFVALLIGLRRWPLGRIARAPIDRSWIRQRIAGSGLIYASDLGIVGAAFLDRFIVDYRTGLEQTGIFTFYWALANAVQVLVNTGIIQMALPRLADAVKAADPIALVRALAAEAVKSLALGIPIAIAIYGAIQLIVPFLHRPQLRLHPWLFPAMLLGSLLRCLSDVANYGLYARGQDRAWSWGNLFSVALAAGFTFVGLSIWGLDGVAYAMCASASVLLVFRCYFLRDLLVRGQISPRQYGSEQTL